MLASDRHELSRAGRDGEPDWRQRQPGVRWLQLRALARRHGDRAGEVVRGGPGLLRHRNLRPATFTTARNPKSWQAPTRRWCWARATTYTSADFAAGGARPERRHRLGADGVHCRGRARARKRHRRRHARRRILRKEASTTRPQLARNLGIQFELVPIGGMFDAYNQGARSGFCRTRRPTSPKRIFRRAFAARC